jgi:hypothetical protein
MGKMGDFFMGADPVAAEHGMDTTYYDDYDDIKGIRGGLVDYWQGLQSGQAPEWLTQYSDQILSSQLQGTNQDYLGFEGDRSNSAFGIARQQDAALGTGKGTGVNRTVQQMMEKKRALREASMKFRAGSMQSEVANSSQGLLGLAGIQGPRAESAAWSTPGSEGSPGFLMDTFKNVVGAGVGGFSNAIGGGLASAGANLGNKIGDMMPFAGKWNGPTTS